MFLFSYKTSICAKCQESWFKILTRWYCTPFCLYIMFPTSLGLCWRCGRRWTQGTFYKCSVLAKNCSSSGLLYITQKCTAHLLQINHAFFLLQHHTFPSKSYQRSILPLLVNVAWSCIPDCWKKRQPPSIAQLKLTTYTG